MPPRTALTARRGAGLLALAVAVLPPCTAVHAQSRLAGESLPVAGGVRVAPFVGWAAGTTRDERWSYTGNEGTPVREQVAMKLADGVAAGVTLQVPVSGMFSFLGGATYVDRDDAHFSIDGGQDWVYTGSRSVFVKAGLALLLHEHDELTVRQLGAGVFAAPFYLLEMPKEIGGIDNAGLFDSSSHFGVNFGFAGQLPFARDRFALLAGLEDYLTFWDQSSLERLPDWLHNAPGSGTRVAADPTHQLVVRAGLSIRVR